MRTQIATLAFSLLFSASAAHAATIVDFSGNANGSLATGQLAVTLDASGDFFTGTISNTSPFAALLTGFGFDIAAGNLNGFSGSPNPITSPGDVDFSFDDGNLGNVPQFNSAELDFGYLTGNNFSGGNPQDGLPTGQFLSFMVSGPFDGFTEAEIAAGLYARFQQVGANGQLSDVARPNGDIPVIPEPGSMLLLGTGLAYLARRRLRTASPQ
jgi:hypothetical protein